MLYIIHSNTKSHDIITALTICCADITEKLNVLYKCSLHADLFPRSLQFEMFLQQMTAQFRGECMPSVMSNKPMPTYSRQCRHVLVDNSDTRYGCLTWLHQEWSQRRVQSQLQCQAAGQWSQSASPLSRTGWHPADCMSLATPVHLLQPARQRPHTSGQQVLGSFLT